MFKMDMGHPPEEAFKETHLAVSFFEEYKCLDCSICGNLFGFQHRSGPIQLFCSQRCLTLGKYQIGCRRHNLGLPELVVSKPELVSMSQQTDDWNSLWGQENVKIEKDDRKNETLSLKFNSLWHQSVKIEKDDRKNEPLPIEFNSLLGQSVKIEKDDRKDEPLLIKSNSLDKNRILGILRGRNRTKNLGPSQNLQLSSSVNETNLKVETPTIKNEIKGAADKISTSSNGSVSNVSLLINELEKKSSNGEVKISSKVCQMNGINPRAVLLSSTKGSTPPPVKIQTPVLPVPVQYEKPQNSVPKLVLIKGPGTATESSPVIEKPVADKKIWTIKNLSMSKSLVNSAPCTVLHPWNIQQYHIQATADQDKLISLQNAIAEYSHEASSPTRVPSVNDILFAPYDDEYFRAKVTVPSSNLNDHLLVSFIDHGDEQMVKLSDCREPKDEIMREHPIYGVVFSLILGEKFPEIFNKDLIPQEVVYEDVTFMTVDKKWHDGFAGKLHLKDGKTMNDVIDDLIRKSRSSPKIWTIQNVNFSDKIQSGAVVLFNFLWNLGKMTLMAKKDRLILEKLQQKIQEFAAKAPSMSRTPQLNEIVIAPYDNLYYRGRVSEINGSNIHVVFIDYGDQATVKLSDIKETNDDIMKDPIYGICLQITRVSPESPLPEEEKKCAELEQLVQSGGVLSIESRDDPTLWTGQLRVGGNKTWSDFVKEVA